RHRWRGLRHCGSHGRRLPRAQHIWRDRAAHPCTSEWRNVAQAAWRACLFRRNSWRIGCWLLGRRQKILWTWSLTLSTRSAANILTTSENCQRKEIFLLEVAGTKNVMVVMKRKIF